MDAAEETGTEGTACPPGLVDATPARQNIKEAALGDNPGQVPPRPAEASDNPGKALLRTANWD